MSYFNEDIVNKIYDQFQQNKTPNKADLFIQLIKWINAPEDFQGMLHVITEVKHCFDALPSDLENITGLNTDDFGVVIAVLNNSSEKIIYSSESHRSKWMSERPVYSLLLASELSTKSIIKKTKLVHYQLLVACFIINYLEHINDFTDKKYSEYLEKETRGLRISLTKNHFKDIPPWPNLDVFLEYIEKERHSTYRSSTSKTHFRELEHFFNNDRKKHRPRRATVINFKEYRLENPAENEPEDSGDMKIKGFYASGVGVDSGGLVIADCFNELPLVEVQEDDKKYEKKHPATTNNPDIKKIKQVNVSAKVRKNRNQTLLSTSLTQPHELFYLFNQLMHTPPTDNGNTHHVPRALVVLTCALSIFLGKSVADIIQLKIGRLIESDGINIIGGTLYFNFKVTQHVKEVNPKRETHCQLKVPLYWQAVIQQIHGNTFTTEQPLIPLIHQKNLAKAVDTYLNKLYRNHEVSITAGALAHIVVQFGASHSSVDLLAFDFAFDNETNATRVKRYYTKFDNESDIAVEINQTWCKLENHIKLFDQTFSFPKGYYQTSGSSKSKSIGSGFAPELEAIQDFTAELKDRLKEDNKFDIKMNLATLLNYHNKYVTYISFMVLYSTGYRAISDPLPNLDMINTRHQLLTITDKDYADRISTRTIPLTDVFSKQVPLYIQHIEALVPLLIAIEPTLAPTIYKAIRPSSTHKTNKFNHESAVDLQHGPLFYLSETKGGNVTVNKIKPKWLSLQTPTFDLAVNAGRHFLRSELNKKIADNETLDYFMEHARYGESAHDEKSSFNIKEAAAQIRPLLNQLMEVCSWQPVVSKIT